MTTETLALPSIEEVSKPLAEMKSFIESQVHADWTPFNQAKKMFLDTFKALQNGMDKQKIWKEFTDISDAARSIRKIQEEEGEFAAEMIAKALDALDADIAAFKGGFYFHPLFEKVASFKAFKTDLASSINQVKFLSSIADKIQALRDELTKTGMRLSVKGRLFDRLSTLGDKVFPIKKDASLYIKDLFKQGLTQFINFAEKHDDGAEVLFQIRIVQSFLKELNLKKSEYDFIRNTLDPVWKKASLLKEKKEAALQEQAVKSQEIKKGFDESFAEIKTLIEESKDEAAMKIYDSLSLKLKDRQIMKNDYKSLKNQLEDISRPLFERLKEQKELLNQALKEKASELKDKKEALLTRLKAEISLEEKKIAFEEAISLNLSLDEVYKFKYTYFAEMAASTSEQDQLEELYFDVKKLQEMVRGALATSSLDFAMSMNLQELNEDVKELLNNVIKKID